MGGLTSSDFASPLLCTMIVGCSGVSWALVGRVCGCLVGQVDDVYSGCGGLIWSGGEFVIRDGQSK